MILTFASEIASSVVSELLYNFALKTLTSSIGSPWNKNASTTKLSAIEVSSSQEKRKNISKK